MLTLGFRACARSFISSWGGNEGSKSKVVPEADRGGRPVNPYAAPSAAVSRSFSCRPHIHILNGFLWQLGIFMAPFGSMGFAVLGRVGGGERGVVFRWRESNASDTKQNWRRRPSGRFYSSFWSLLLMSWRFIPGFVLVLFRLHPSESTWSGTLLRSLSTAKSRIPAEQSVARICGFKDVILCINVVDYLKSD